MEITIYPANLKGMSVCAPPSKSAAHRELICSGLAGGVSRISNLALSEDILATMDCLRSLGADIRFDRETMMASVRGTDPVERAEMNLQCRESGSTLRFMCPICALSEAPAVLSGSRRLMERPMAVYEDLFRGKGLIVERTDSSVRIEGKMKGGEYRIPGSISSQFVSGLLFALPLLREDSSISLEGSINSRPYIEMTLKTLKEHGVWAEWLGDAQICVPGDQQYKPSDSVIEGDWSNAAYLMAAGASVTGLDSFSLQGDSVCIQYFRQLDDGPAEIDISDCPDLGPVMMAYAAMRSGAILHGTDRLRYKESDRGSAMREELAKFGVEVSIGDDSIKVGHGLSAPRETLYGHNDHRIVMALSAMCIRTGGTIDGADAVIKSFPDYFEVLSELGVEIKKENGPA